MASRGPEQDSTVIVDEHPIDLLMFVGSKWYPTIESFVEEASRLGVSKRLGQMPSAWGLFSGSKCVRSIKTRDEGIKIIKNVKEHGANGNCLYVRRLVKLGESRVFLAHDEGKKGRARIFGFFIIRAVEVILETLESINEFTDKKNELGIEAVSAGQAQLEPARGCGHRMVGSLYFMSSQDMKMLMEIAEPIADKVDFKGGLVVLKDPIPYDGSRFRGYSFFDPTSVGIMIARTAPQFVEAAIKIRPRLRIPKPEPMTPDNFLKALGLAEVKAV